MTFRRLNRIQAPEEKIPSLNLQNLQATFYPYGIIYSVSEEKILLPNDNAEYTTSLQCITKEFPYHFTPTGQFH